MRGPPSTYLGPLLAGRPFFARMALQARKAREARELGCLPFPRSAPWPSFPPPSSLVCPLCVPPSWGRPSTLGWELLSESPRASAVVLRSQLDRKGSGHLNDRGPRSRKEQEQRGGSSCSRQPGLTLDMGGTTNQAVEMRLSTESNSGTQLC